MRSYPCASVLSVAPSDCLGQIESHTSEPGDAFSVASDDGITCGVAAMFDAFAASDPDAVNGVCVGCEYPGIEKLVAVPFQECGMRCIK